MPDLEKAVEIAYRVSIKHGGGVNACMKVQWGKREPMRGRVEENRD